MSTTTREVLNQYATRYQIPKRRPDGSFKDESELAQEISEREQRQPIVSDGCFFIEKRFGLAIERTAPLKVYPRRYRNPSQGASPPLEHPLQRNTL